MDNVSPIEREHGVSANNDPIDDETIAPFADRMGAGAKPRRHDGVAVLTRSLSQASTIFAATSVPRAESATALWPKDAYVRRSTS